MKDFNFKNCYNCNDLIRIVEILRAPGGCPWDAEQTHESIRKNFIEETYEVVEAINKADPAMLREELGDVLLQVALHAQMETEKGVFNFDDVCDEICKKLIVRHPHVFGDVKADTSEEVLKNWDAIKMQTKQQKTATETMESIPREFPALMRAQKVQKKAARAGFDWDDSEGAFEKIAEETAELKAAIASGDQGRIDDEAGDLLFSVVNVCRFSGSDAEEALTFSTDKFMRRFACVEKLAAERNIDMKNSSIEELDSLWNEVKASENK